MPFTITTNRLPGHIRFEVVGPASLKNYFDLIDEAARTTRADGDKKVLVDLQGVAGRLNFTDQFFIGDVAGEKLAHLDKVALVVADDPSSYNSPTVANRKGLNMRTFNSTAGASAWLLDNGD